jgi:hypothetical protein
MFRNLSGGFADRLSVRSFTSPDIPLPSYPEDFQGSLWHLEIQRTILLNIHSGNQIPVDGEALAKLCIERLTLEGEVDDG